MRRLLLQSSSIAACLTCLAPGVAAQDMLASAGAPENVLITGSGLTRSIYENTQQATIVTEVDIKRGNFTNLTEVLRFQPGLEFKQAGAPGQFNYIKLRGLSSSILFVIDGIKVNEPASGNMGNVIGQLDPSIIEKIEILRGPQATTFGADSTAGAIVITTKGGSVQDAHVAGEYGSLDWKKAMLGLRGSTEVGGGTLRYSINMSKLDSDGIWRHEFTRNQTVQGRLDYTIDKLTVGGSFFQTINKFQYAELTEAYGGQTPATYWSWQTPDPHSYSGTNELVANAFAQYQVFDSLTAKVSYGTFQKYYSTHDRDDGFLGNQVVPYNGWNNNFSIPAPGLNKGDLFAIYDSASSYGGIDSYFRDRRNQLNATLTYSRGMFQGLAGFEHMYEAAHQYGTYGELTGKQGIYSYYGLGQLKPFDEKLTLAAGVRHDSYSYSWGSATTYNLGASYRATDYVDLFVNYGTSFTAPTGFQLYSGSYGNLKVKPESGKTIEGGIRLDFLENRLHADITYWNSRIDDVIVFDFSIPNPKSIYGYGLYTNGPQGKTQGVEFSTFYDVMQIEGLRLYANYTYTDSFQQDSAGVWLTTVQIAKNKGNIGALYTWGDLTVGVNLLLNGPRLRWARDVSTAGYGRLDLSARYRFFDHWSVYTRVQNVLDHRIIEEVGYRQMGIYGIAGIEYQFY